MPDPATNQPSPWVDLDLLAEVSELLTVIDLDHVLERVVALTARSVGADKASLFLRQPHSDEWQRLIITRELEPEESARVVQSVLESGVAGWVMREQRGTVVFDTETDSRWHIFTNEPTPPRSALCLPLIQDNEVLAIITLTHTQPNHFSEHHLRVLNIVANQAAVAIRNAQLFYRMQAQQSQLEAILHAIPDMLLVVDNAGIILVANDAAAEFVGGVTRQDLIGQSLDSIIEVDNALDRLKELDTRPALTESTWTFETHSDRKRQDYVVTVSRWQDQPRGATGHVIIKHDVTTLRDLDRFKSEMLKMASHDLRSPLALIVGYCDLIGFDTPPGSEQAEYLDVITRSTRRMSTLLDDLLRVEEIRSSPKEMQNPTDFGELVGEVVDNLRMIADSKQQTVELDLRLEGLEPVTLDSILIREAMENLTTNASKYTAEGGRIRVESYYDDHHVHFVVVDSGVGIAEYDVARIFDWGFRAKRHAETSTIDGKGMGLSLVKTVLERHGGDVWVESEEGVGSKFGFWLPRDLRS